jgi:DNA-binding NarL/FixJ family response regulator
VVASADEALAERLARILATEGISRCALATSELEAIEAARRERPRLCLVDLSLPGDPIAAVERILAVEASATVVALAPSPDQQTCLDALRSGADGYVAADVEDGELAASLRAVLHDQGSVPAPFLSGLVEELRRL